MILLVAGESISTTNFGRGGAVPTLKTKITFKAPCRELYFAYRRILQAATTLDDIGDISRHVIVLVTTIKEIFADTGKQVTDLLSR